jgi:prophage regulatory protein
MSAKPISIIQAPPLIVAREHAAAALGISERTLEGLVRDGSLPPPRKISRNRTGWLWRELQDFSESLPVSDLAPGPGRKAHQGGQQAA